MATSAKRSRLNTPVQKDEWQKFFKKLGRGMEIEQSITKIIPIWDLSPSVYFLFDSDQPDHQDQSHAELDRQFHIHVDMDQPAFNRLSAAVKLGKWATETYSVKKLFDEFPQINTDTPDKHNLSLLHICALRSCDDDHNYCRIAEFLVQTGCDVNRASSNGRVTPLMVAVKQGHSCMVKCLLTLLADPNLRDWRNSTALSLACSYPDDRKSIVDQLLIFGADYAVQFFSFEGIDNIFVGDNIGAKRTIEFVQKKINEMMLLRVRSAADDELKQFRLIQPLHPAIYESVELRDQLCLDFCMSKIDADRHSSVTSNDQLLLLIGTVEWRKVGVEGDILSGFDLHQLNLNPTELKGKASLNGITIATSRSDRANIKMKPIKTARDRTDKNRMIEDVVVIRLAKPIIKRKPIVVVLQIWEVERQLIQVE